MKKLYLSKSKKKYNQKCQKRSLKNRRRKKFYLKIKTTKDYRKKVQKQKVAKIKKEVPKKNIAFGKNFNFSFIENTENLLRIINDAKDCFKNGKNVFFNLKEITKVTTDAITLYIALITDKKFTKSNYFQGNLPEDKELKLIFVKCGFFNYVDSEIPKDLQTEQIFNIESQKKCEPKIAKKICDKIFPQKRHQSQPLYEILLELMNNTHNHASGNDEEGKYHWCFQSYYDEEKKTYKCSFIDVGIGIFKSLLVEDYKKKQMLVIPESNKNLFTKVLNGTIKDKKKSFTRTNKISRGKGIPLVYNTITKEEQFLKFIIITNDVFAVVKDGSKKENFKTLKNPFEGTFYYWEIKNESKS